MEIKGLQYFLRAAECLNFTRAARECFITQTAMSQHIAGMERELGFQLFIRNNRNVELTVAGREFYERVKAILQSYDDAVSRGRNLASGSQGSVTILVSSSLDGLVFTPRLHQFKLENPTIDMRVIVASPRHIVSRLRRGEADLILFWPTEMRYHDDIFVHNLAEFKACLICRRDHPLASFARITPEQLRKSTITMVDLVSMPNTLHIHYRLWQQVGLPVQSEESLFNKVNQMEEVLFSVLINNCVAIVPEFARAHTSAEYACIDLELPAPLMFTMSSGYLRKNQNPALPLLVETLRDNRIPLQY